MEREVAPKAFLGANTVYCCLTSISSMVCLLEKGRKMSVIDEAAKNAFYRVRTNVLKKKTVPITSTVKQYTWKVVSSAAIKT